MSRFVRFALVPLLAILLAACQFAPRKPSSVAIDEREAEGEYDYGPLRARELYPGSQEVAGVACDRGSDCATVKCINGTCSSRRYPIGCVDNGEISSRDIDCCSGMRSGAASGRVCAPTKSFRSLVGQVCFAGADCYSGECDAAPGRCLASRRECSPVSRACATASECCSGKCDALRGFCRGGESDPARPGEPCSVSSECLFGRCDSGAGVCADGTH